MHYGKILNTLIFTEQQGGVRNMNIINVMVKNSGPSGNQPTLAEKNS